MGGKHIVLIRSIGLAACLAERFEARARMLAAQYSAFETLPGLHVNGELTLGENIADLGGLTVALDAYRASLQGEPSPVLNALIGSGCLAPRATSMPGTRLLACSPATRCTSRRISACEYA